MGTVSEIAFPIGQERYALATVMINITYNGKYSNAVRPAQQLKIFLKAAIPSSRVEEIITVKASNRSATFTKDLKLKL